MKKFFALFLCCALLAGLLAACGSGDGTAPPFMSPSDIYTAAPAGTEASEIPAAAEGREPHFEFTAGDITYYVYNNVTLDELTFSQVQFSFSDSSLRVSCTSSTQTDPSEAVSAWNTALSAIYGTPSESGGNYTWSDGSGNYITLCAINETTAQLAF